jgi:hypothetical protein
MAAYTVGEFANALKGVADALGGISERLNSCDLDVVIDGTPGRTAICQGPVIKAGMCLTSGAEVFRVRDLLETVEGLRDWVEDVRSKLDNYDVTAALDSGLAGTPGEEPKI